jgi:hypothetical protein
MFSTLHLPTVLPTLPGLPSRLWQSEFDKCDPHHKLFRRSGANRSVCVEGLDV